MPFIGLIAGAGMGIAKHYAVDKPNEERKNKLAAEVTRYSPWTHLKGEMADPENVLNSAMQGGGTGLALGQSIDTAGKDSVFRDSQVALNTAKTAAYNRSRGIIPDPEASDSDLRMRDDGGSYWQNGSRRY